MRGTIAAVGLLGLLAACGSETPHTLPQTDERVPITQRAVAAIMLEHLPDDTTTREAMYADDTDRPGTLGADLRYGGGGETDGELVRAALVPGTRDQPCEERCVQLETAVEGASLTLHWDEGNPEEDPGIVALALQRDDEYTYVYQSGPKVTEDPRELDLDISVEDMVEIAEDAWLRLETSPEAVRAGEGLDEWEGGEPDPHAYDRVPNTDLGMIAAYQGFGFGGEFTDYGISPLKGDLGPGAIGGRMTRTGDSGYGPDQVVFDLLAAPDPDAWMGEDPCVTWQWECAESTGRKGPLYLLWRPASGADPGVIWAGTRRTDQVIAIRMAGPAVPRSKDGVLVDTEWYLLEEFLGRDRRVGIETDQEVLDRAADLPR